MKSFCNDCLNKQMTSQNINGVKEITCSNCKEKNYIGFLSESDLCAECCEILNICPECGKQKTD